jgi:segregation and condensation protein B
MNEQDARKVLEAVLFSSSEVMPARRIAGIIGNTRVPLVHEWVAALNAEYETTNRTFRIARIGDGYQMRTLPMYRTWIAKAEPLKPVRLSPPSLETLSIVAYRQPVTRAEIEHLRGVDCSGSLRRLLELRLVRIVGKDQGPGRAILYGTGREFLSLFNLADLKDLPTLEELDLWPEEKAPPAAILGGEAG